MNSDINIQIEYAKTHIDEPVYPGMSSMSKYAAFAAAAILTRAFSDLVANMNKRMANEYYKNGTKAVWR